MYLFKNYDLKDWVSFAEVFGLPLRLGKYQPGASDEDKTALMQALIQIGADAAGIIPDGTSIEFITTEKTSSTDLYERRELRAKQDPQRSPSRPHGRRLQSSRFHVPALPYPSPGTL
jgi:phage gp29-like protein